VAVWLVRSSQRVAHLEEPGWRLTWRGCLSLLPHLSRIHPANTFAAAVAPLLTLPEQIIQGNPDYRD
jgi:hypothetical protein